MGNTGFKKRVYSIVILLFFLGVAIALADSNAPDYYQIKIWQGTSTSVTSIIKDWATICDTDPSNDAHDYSGGYNCTYNVGTASSPGNCSVEGDYYFQWRFYDEYAGTYTYTYTGAKDTWVNCEGVACAPSGVFIYNVNYDSDPNDCECKVGAGRYNLGGDIDGTECCTDDAGENYRTRVASATMDNGYLSSTADDACCDAGTDCVDDSTCTTSGSTRNADDDSDVDYCSSGTWYDCNSYTHCAYNGGYKVCSANNCVSCTQNSDCPTGYYCNDDGACHSKKAAGETCDWTVTESDSSSESNGVCSSGYCRDDYDNGEDGDGLCESGEACWCTDSSTDCATDSTSINTGSYAPNDCKSTGSGTTPGGRALCNSGAWTSSSCGYSAYNSCSGACQKGRDVYYCDNSNNGCYDGGTNIYSYLTTAGMVCSAGGEVAPSSGINCNAVINCTTGSCSAPRYYLGCAAGSTSCTNTGRVAYATWNATSNYVISETNYKSGTTCNLGTIYCGASAGSCTGSGSPYSCQITQNRLRCNGAGVCNYDSGIDLITNVSSGNVCNGGVQVSGSSTYYAFSGTSDRCSTSIPGSGFGDRVYDVYACNGNNAQGPDVGDRTIDCGTGCCYDAGSTTSCVSSGNYGTYNWYNFGIGDGIATDYCTSSQVLDCNTNSDCATGYYCSANSCVNTCTQNSNCPSGFFCNSAGSCQAKLANGVACVGATAVSNNTEQDGACTSGYCDNDGVGSADDGWCFSPYSTYYDGQENTKCEKSATSVVSDASDEKTGNACDSTSGWINSACYYFSDGDSNSQTCTCRKGAGYWSIGGEVSVSTCCDDGSEYKRTRVISGTMDNGYSNSSADDACCNANTKCVNNSVCYATGYVSGDADSDGDTDYCNAGMWYDCLDDSNCPSGYYCNGNDCDVCTASQCLDHPNCRDGDICCDDDAECGTGRICVSEQINTNQASCADTYQCRDTEILALGTVMDTTYSQGAFWSGDSSGSGECGDHAYEAPLSPDGDLCMRYDVYDADSATGALVVTTDHDTNTLSSSPASTNEVWYYNYIYNASDSADFHQLEIRTWDTGFGNVMYGYYISETGSGADGSSSTGCCPDITNCVDDALVGSATDQDGCYVTGTFTDTGGGDGIDTEECRSGIWYAQDADQTACENAGNYWNIGGEVDSTTCCEDDASEYKLEANYSSVVDDYSPNKVPAITDACCDATTDCVHSNSCYSSTSSYDVNSNGDTDYCNAGQWLDCSDVGNCDPTGEYAYGESNNPCSGSTECHESCSSNNCVYQRYEGWGDCDANNGCYNSDCIQDTNFATTFLGTGVCDNNVGAICTGGSSDSYDVCVASGSCLIDHDYDDAMADCAGSNCIVSSGNNTVDLDNDGDTDYCNAGLWYDCLDDSNCDTANGFYCDGGDCTEKCEVPGSGTWTITDNQVCRDMHLNYSGAINITSGGSLTLHNVNLTLNYETAGRYPLTINSGAKLYLNETNISEWANSNYYYVRNYGELEAYSSDLRTTTSPDRVYLYLYSGSASSIEDSDTHLVYTYAPSAKANITNTTMYRLYNNIGSGSVVSIDSLDQDDSDIDYDIVSSTGSYNISLVDCDFSSSSGLHFSNDGGTLSINNSNIYYLYHYTDANDDTNVSDSYIDFLFYYNYGDGQNITLEDINPAYASGYSKTISASNGNDLRLSNIGLGVLSYYGYGTNTEVHVDNCTFYYFYTYSSAKSYVENSLITSLLYNYGTSSKSYFTNVNATYRPYMQGTSYLECNNCNFDASSYTLVSDTAILNFTNASYVNKYYQYSSNPKIYGFVNFTNFYSWRLGTIDREIPFNLTYYGGSPASGKNITIKSGATPVDSGITDANGMVYLEILDAPSQSATWDVYVEGSNLSSITIFENSAPYGVELQISCTKNSDCGGGYYCNSSYQCSETLSDGATCVGATAVSNNTEQDGACTSGYCDNDGVGSADDGWCFTPHSTYYDGQETTKCEKSATSVVSNDADEKTGNACDSTSGWINSTCYYFSDGDSNSNTCVCVSGVDMYYSGGSGQLKCCGDDGGSDNFCAGGSWYCNAGTKTADGDVSSSACSCLGHDWLTNGTGTNSDCCGDDGSEEYFEQSESAGSSCCYNGTVLTNGSASGPVLCFNGQLYDCNNQVTLGIETEVSNCNQASTSGMYCDATGVPSYWQEGIPIGCGGCQQNSECSGGGGTPLCDAENGAVEPLYGLVSDENTCFACDVCGAGAFRCSSENGLCQYDCAASEDCDDTAPDYCVDNTGESNDQYYCDAGCVVRDRDYGETVCEKSNNDCVAYDWATGGEVSSFGGYDTGAATECCGDDSDEYLRNTSLSGSYYSACCNAITDCVNATNKCVASDTEQGGYYCINGVWNTLPTHDTPYIGSHRINTTDLIAYWTLDNDVDDSSGNSYDGTIYGNASNTREGRVSGAYVFDGNDNVLYGDVLDMGLSDLTISLWVKKSNSPSTAQYILSKSRAAAQDYRYAVRISTSGAPGMFMQGDGGADVSFDGSSSVCDGNWHHLAFIYDRDGNASIFIDGKYETGRSISHWVSADMQSENPFRLGSYTAVDNVTASAFYSGLLDEVAIYNRSLNSTEVAELYNMTYKTYTLNDLACAPNASSDSDGDNMTYIFNWYKDDSSVMVLNMPFDNNISSTSSGAVRDYSPNENNGTLGGGTSSYVPTYTTGSDCISGGCYEFDGDDYLTVNDSSSISLTSQISVEAWVRSYGTSTLGVITKGPSSGDYDYMLYFTTSGTVIDGYIKDSTGTAENVGGTSFSWADGDYHHYVLSFDGDYLRLYADGLLRSEKDSSRTNIRDSVNPLFLGKGWSGNLNGTIDEVKIYNISLTPEQVYANYVAGLNAHQPDVIAWNQTSKGEEWKCSVTVSDGTWDSDTKNSSSITIQNSPPTVPTLTNPEDNNNTITNRTQVFNWSASTDPDGDSITYTINIDRTACPYAKYCNGTDPINQASISNLYYTPSSNLDLSPYNWNVKACDSWVCSDWSDTRNFTVIPYVAIDLVHSTTDFGTLSIDETKNTTANAPGQTNGPLLVRNSGNCFVNITVNATNPYSSTSTNTEYFKFLASTYSGEPGSFNTSCSQTTWMNMSTTQKNSICGLNFADSTDEARLDLLITIPPAEPTGAKSSTVMVTADMD